MKSSGRHEKSNPVPVPDPVVDEVLPERVADDALPETVGDDAPLLGEPIAPVPMTDVDGTMGGVIGMPIVGIVGVPIVGNVGVPIAGNVGVPIVGESVVPIGVVSGVPIVGRSGVPIVGWVGVPIAGLPAVGVPIVGVVGVPIAGVVGVPIVCMVGVPIVGVVGVPIVGRVGVPIAGEPIVGSVVAPTPNVGERGLMPGVIPACIDGDADVLMPGDVDTIAPKFVRLEELETALCAWVAHGAEANAIGITHFTIFFMTPPCLFEIDPFTRSTRRRASGSALDMTIGYGASRCVSPQISGSHGC
jgi:hypothetical protein